MCLVTRLTKPFVAKKDIVCYKHLCKSGDDYTTPFQDVKVKLGKKMVANAKRKYEGEDWNNYCKHGIEDGFIHALLGKKGINGNVAVKAIIPAGTEFYVGDDCIEVCARKLILTTEVISPADVPDAKIAIRELFADYFESFFEAPEVEVAVGYYRLADGGYVNPLNLTDDIKDDIMGIVACIHDGKVYVVSLDCTASEWRTDDWTKFTMVCKKQHTNWTSVEDDFDGEGNTKAVLSHYTYSPERYPAFALIANYQTKGTKKGDWHMGAAGEIIAIGRDNQFKINLAMALLDNATMIDYEWLWSSSEYTGSNAWGLDPSNGNVDRNNKYGSLRVRAFAAFNA